MGRLKFLLIPLVAAAADPRFQPSPPYHAAFFYPWYPQWTDQRHSPPDNWFSNYLPDPNPCVFDPASELYDSTDTRILYWQLRKMAEARIEVAIASWWGRAHKTDRALRVIIGDAMNRQDNPYPNLRWAVYYEAESLRDPAPDELTSDLEYIRDNFASQPAYLRVDGKPVVFVYATGSDQSGMAERWAEARRRTGFYVVLKVYAGYRNDPNQPDSWHQYAPANRIDTQLPYSILVSPGFWLDGQNVRLERDLPAFRAALSRLVAADVTWKLIQTWNEWGEGTSVEPGEEVRQTTSGKARPNPDGKPFRNLYVDALRELLPPLEQGTGALDGDSRVLHAASREPGPVSPGQLVLVQDPAEIFQIECESVLARQRIGGAGVVAIPKSVGGKAYVRLEIGGGWTMLPVVPANPALFTVDGVAAAAVNEDGALNSLANPAPAGSVVSLYGTGAGVNPSEAVAVEIAGVPAKVLYAGESDGLLQINVLVPAVEISGAVAVYVTARGASSPPGVALYVRKESGTP